VSELEPFGRLETDEPTTESAIDRIKRDTDARFAAGCALFSIAATLHGVGSIAIVSIIDPKTNAALVDLIVKLGVFGLIAGAILIAIEPVSAYFGSLGGQLCGGVYLFFRLRESALGYEGIEGLEQAEYGVEMSYLVTIAMWVGLALLLAAIAAIRSILSKRWQLGRDRKGL
jgi:hypothetical protein